MPWVSNSSRFIHSFPRFSTESLTSWETPPSWANQDSWSPCQYPLVPFHSVSHTQLFWPCERHSTPNLPAAKVSPTWPWTPSNFTDQPLALL